MKRTFVLFAIALLTMIGGATDSVAAELRCVLRRSISATQPSISRPLSAASAGQPIPKGNTKNSKHTGTSRPPRIGRLHREFEGLHGALERLVGATYSMRCSDNRGDLIFDAVMQFTSEHRARWRHADSETWNEWLQIWHMDRHLRGPNYVRLSVDLRDSAGETETWNLEFSEDLREVTGTLFLTPIEHAPVLTVTGSILASTEPVRRKSRTEAQKDLPRRTRRKLS